MEIEIKIPAVGESVTEVTLAQWIAEDGAYVHMDDAICEMETDKASQELYAEKAGKLIHVASEGDDLEVGALVAKIDTSVKPPAESAPAKEEPKAKKEVVVAAPKAVEKSNGTAKESASAAAGHPSPAAAKLMAENGLSSGQITATGKGGRITKQDVLQAIKTGVTSIQAGFGSMANAAPAFSREERTEKVSRLRQTIATRLVEAKNSTAMLTTFNEVDCGNMMAIRKKYKEQFAKTHDIGLGFMSFFSRACALALEKFPAVNAYLDEEKKQVIYHDYVDISIAVSTPKGLVVPVIRNVESLTMAGIEKSVKDLAIRGRNGDLSMEDMEGGTFTITNGGVFGSLMSTPIINPPQSAILGMHKIEERPIAVDGKVVIRPMMYLALSYDHRIIDGKESVSFLVTVKDYLENPEKMLIGADPVQALLGFDV